MTSLQYYCIPGLAEIKSYAQVTKSLQVLRFANNKGADQPAHLRRLISAFIISLLESIISKLAMREISIF